MKKIGLLGFGKIGQAIAGQILDCGHELIAIDIDPRLKTALQEESFTSSEPGVAPSIKAAYVEGRLSIETEMSPLKQCHSVIVCIPLFLSNPLNGAATIDYLPFDQGFHSLADVVHDKMLISLETTVPVGTCRHRLVQIFSEHGKTHGRDFLLCFSPERIMSNTMREQLVTNPKIVGGITQDALAAAVDLYKTFLPPELVEPVSSIEVAEMIKLTAMVARDINIAIVNQLSVYCEKAKIDFREVLSHVNSDQVSHLLSPGIGVGGHCTPVYPYFLIENFAQVNLSFSLAQEARNINDSMVEYIAKGVCDEFSIKTALILGLGFRPNVKEDTCSPAYQLNQILKQRGVDTFIHDSLYTSKELCDKGFRPVNDLYEQSFDALFLVTAHDQYCNLDFSRLSRLGCKIILDGRNALDQKNILDSKIAYRGVGTGCFRQDLASSNVPQLNK